MQQCSTLYAGFLSERYDTTETKVALQERVCHGGLSEKL